MRLRGTATADRSLSLAVVLVAGLSFCSHTRADDTAPETAQLALMVRQLDLIDREAQHAASLPAFGNSRYHFDYARFQSDLSVIRAGVADYLSPPRAQPRDLTGLNGFYRNPADSAQ
jgi:RAQPRD family integrative conjugative element protein